MGKRFGYTAYDGETARIVKDDFEELYRQKKPVEEITLQLENQYRPQLTDDEMEVDFWLPLASAQWEWGVLLPEIREKALSILEHTPMDTFWDVREKMEMPSPPPKKPRKRRSYRCPWENGDVFAWKLESELAKELGLDGRYLLLQKVDMCFWHPSHFIPILYAKLTKDENLPEDVSAFDRLEYIQVGFTPYMSRFYPIDVRRAKEDIEEKSREKYEVDEFGTLPEYRFSMITTSAKNIPENLLFLGNFSGSTPPQKEFVPRVHLNVRCEFWEKFGENFETKLLKKYKDYNLRQLSFYQNPNPQQDEATRKLLAFMVSMSEEMQEK